MTATKALAGGLATNVAVVVLWLLGQIPGWDAIPTEPKAAIFALVVTGIGYGCVYAAPANRPIADAFEAIAIQPPAERTNLIGGLAEPK